MGVPERVSITTTHLYLVPPPPVRTLGDKLQELARRAPAFVIAIEHWVDYLLRAMPPAS